ncbi:MAG TPA: hypothetical protein VMF64_09500 [Steroidobacteraceae bacterium]|nr:hypothetical protein [Steroidobacteraceae bacterium]
MRKVVIEAIGVLALSLGAASAASAAQWAGAAHYGFQAAAHTNWATTQSTSATSAPEIDPAGALSGLTLLLGGLAIVRGRRLRK